MRFLHLLLLFNPILVGSAGDSIFNLRDDTVKVQKLLDLGFQYEITDPDSAIMVYAMAGDISLEIDYKLGLGRSLNYSGIVEFSRENYLEAEQFYYRSIEVFKEIPYPRGIAANYNNIGNIYHHLGEFDRTVQFHMQALDIFEEIRDTLSMIFNLNNLGTLYYDNNQYEAAIDFYLRSSVLLEGMQDTVRLIDTYVNLANTYNRQKDFEKAALYLNRADLIHKPGVNLYGSLLLSDAKRELQFSRGNYMEAFKYSGESLELAEELGSAYDYTRVLTTRGEILLELGRSSEALFTYNQAIDTARKHRYLNLLERLYAGRAALYENQGQYSYAYRDLSELSMVRDSLYKKERQEIIHEMEARYQNAKKQQLIEENEAIIAEQEYRAARQRSLLIWIGITSAGIIFTILLVIAFLQQRRNVLQAKIENLEKEKELKSLKYIIEGEEKERSRLAKELHDGVNGSLGAIRLMADSGNASNGKGNPNIEKIISLIDQVSTEVRDISHNLMPDVITQYGLIQAIESYLERIQSSERLKTDFQHYGEFEDIDNSIKVTVYRIVQELTRNIIKHSGAAECLIQINRHVRNLSLVVEDNGGGFNVFEQSHIEKPEGIGLQSIYSRINLIEGKIDIQSELNSGTSVNIDIPLKKTEA